MSNWNLRKVFKIPLQSDNHTGPISSSHLKSGCAAYLFPLENVISSNVYDYSIPNGGEG